MPLNNEQSSSSSPAGEQGSDRESSSDRCDSGTSASDLDCSRQSFTSAGSSKHSSPSSSPPKAITLDEVMASARDLSNLRLAHEIIVNHQFHVEQPNLPENSLVKHVRDMVHKVYWDQLESELNADPPEYKHAIKLLEEIQEILLSFLNPGANRLRTQILEVLDMDLIRQQAEQEAVDIQGLASYIITTMGKFCAPARDEEIKKLKQISGNMVVMFKEIFRVLDLMKLDFVNFTIQSLRPELQKQSVEYEQQKFQDILDKTPSALDHTTAWMQASLEELMGVAPAAQGTEGWKALPGPLLVLNTGFIRILTTWDYDKPLPETLMTDEGRLREHRLRLQLLQTVASVLLIVYSSIGEPIRGLPTLNDRLKRVTSALLEGMSSPWFNLEEALDSVSVQICSELNRSLTERSYPTLPPALQDTLRGSIRGITQPNDPVRCLVAERVQQYFRMLLSTPSSPGHPTPLPPGLGVIGSELTTLGVAFACLVHFNIQVYTPFYTGILKSLLFSNATSRNSTQDSTQQEPSQTAAQAPAKDPTNSPAKDPAHSPVTSN